MRFVPVLQVFLSKLSCQTNTTTHPAATTSLNLQSVRADILEWATQTMTD